MTDKTQNTLRLGERVVRRVGAGPTGDIMGILQSASGHIDSLQGAGFAVNRNDDRKVLNVGWEDGTQSWESPNELRKADET